MQQHAEGIEFKVGDPVLVLLGRGGDEWIEKAEVAAVCDDNLVLRVTDRSGDCFLPVHARYVMHRCSECGQEPTTQAGYVCMACFFNDLSVVAWVKHTTPVQRFRDASIYLPAEHRVRGAA